MDGGLKFFGRALWKALRALHRPTVNVCIDCIADLDERVAQAGDYSLCHRCKKPISSKDGFEVREGKA